MTTPETTIALPDAIRQRHLTTSLTAMLRLALVAVLVAATVSACAPRPGPESLLPVANLPQANDELTVLAATNRSLLTTDPPSYGSGRGDMSYEEFRLQASGKISSKSPVAAMDQSADIADFDVARRLRLGHGGFLQRVRELQRSDDNTLILFVHGYNNSYQEAIFRLASVAFEARQKATPIVFSWPSEASVTGYVSDRDSSTYARDDLVALLTDLSNANPDSRIIVVGHSMGGWLVMEALRQLRLLRRDNVFSHIQVGLASPDIDLDVFRRQVADVGRLSPPLTVLVSRDDRALAASARVAGGRQRLGAVDVDNPQMQKLARQAGIRMIDISALPASSPANHDRLLALAALQSTAASNNPLSELRNTGAYVLSGAGRILATGE